MIVRASRPRPRRLVAGIALALAALVLAGCGGIPTSGPVVAGPPLSEAEPDYVVTPNGPGKGDTPEQILAGFMLAVRAPQRSYYIAQEFLTPTLAASWKPDAVVYIRSDEVATSEAAGSSTATPRLDYVFDSRASVDAQGRYRETAASTSHSMEFAFAQVDGEWRISAAPDGIVLSEIAFVRAFAAKPLYFFDASGRYLVPDVRWFAAGSTAAPAAVEALLAGPDAWLAPALVTDFPSGTTLGTGGVVVTGSHTTVDLSAQAASASPAALGRMQQQLAATLAVPDLSLSAGGVPIGPGTVSSLPAKDPQPSAAVIAGTGTAFGPATVDGVSPIDLSAVLVADGATAATLAHDQRSAAYLDAGGAARLAVAGLGSSRAIDARPGLVAPTLDPQGFIWSATGGVGGVIDAFSRDGKAVGVDVEDLPVGAGIVAIAMSRDGTRLAVLLSSDAGPRLLVYGVARQSESGTPTQLRSPLELATPSGAPVGVAWVDEDSLVVVSATPSGDTTDRAAYLIPIGSPSSGLGSVGADGVVVGGVGGVSGLRALSGGDVLAWSGTSWSSTGIAARFLAVQQ